MFKGQLWAKEMMGEYLDANNNAEDEEQDEDEFDDWYWELRVERFRFMHVAFALCTTYLCATYSIIVVCLGYVYCVG